MKRYIRINFQGSPSVATPLNATNLNKMDKGIDDLDNAIETLNDNLGLVRLIFAPIADITLHEQNVYKSGHNICGYLFFTVNTTINPWSAIMTCQGINTQLNYLYNNKSDMSGIYIGADSVYTGNATLAAGTLLMVSVCAVDR